jgi:hypothetical protein
MTSVLEELVPPQRVGKIEMRVAVAEPTPESQQRWSRRSEAIAAWLLAEWKRQQVQGCREAS